MGHCCFISFKKEDIKYKDKILKKLGKERIVGKALDKNIVSDNIDYVMQEIRKNYMSNSTVTIFLIGKHSSENEGVDSKNRNKQAFIIRELQATLYDRKNNPRDGLLGIVLPEMENTIYLKSDNYTNSDKHTRALCLNDTTVIREFYENYWLKKDSSSQYYTYEGEFCVLVRYSEFMQNPDKFIDMAYEKTKMPIAKQVKVYCEHENL